RRASSPAPARPSPPSARSRTRRSCSTRRTTPARPSSRSSSTPAKRTYAASSRTSAASRRDRRPTRRRTSARSSRLFSAIPARPHITAARGGSALLALDRDEALVVVALHREEERVRVRGADRRARLVRVLHRLVVDLGDDVAGQDVLVRRARRVHAVDEGAS